MITLKTVLPYVEKFDHCIKSSSAIPTVSVAMLWCEQLHRLVQQCCLERQASGARFVLSSWGTNQLRHGKEPRRLVSSGAYTPSFSSSPQGSHVCQSGLLQVGHSKQEIYDISVLLSCCISGLSERNPVCRHSEPLHHWGGGTVRWRRAGMACLIAWDASSLSWDGKDVSGPEVGQKLTTMPHYSLSKK